MSGEKAKGSKKGRKHNRNRAKCARYRRTHAEKKAGHKVNHGPRMSSADYLTTVHPHIVQTGRNRRRHGPTYSMVVRIMGEARAYGLRGPSKVAGNDALAQSWNRAVAAFRAGYGS